MPYNSNQITYRQRLTPWAIAQLLPNMQRTIVGRFRSRSDADGHLRCLRQLIPHASFVVVFDPQPDEETVSVSLTTAQKAVIGG
ncbi:MAG: hypothetical protein RIG63_28890 [Coleofasciculus chthonoplastes F3-SA18-01]|uniref:hypothetical protein n=1 Tax=Coleofasciculus chthonoplastes TaxID=64178 RepID=UPI00330032FA